MTTGLEQDLAAWYRFDEAINPYGCSPAVVEAMEGFARSKAFRFYGEATADTLRERLAAYFALSPENFLVYNGAGEAVAWIYVLHLLVQRRRIIVPYPSYERFVEAAKLCAPEVVEFPLRPDFSLPLDEFIDTARRSGATVGLLSNPNSPPGNLLVDAPGLRRLLAEVPECLWIVDEAFADYPGISFAPWVHEQQNLIVVRTFSKAYGLAGLRVGYAVAHESVIRSLTRFYIPWGVDSMAVVAAAAALDDQAYLRGVVAQTKRDCEALRQALSRHAQLEIRPTVTNFLYVKVHDGRCAQVTTALAARRIRVRSRPDFQDYFRITSLRPDDNRYLLDALGGILPLMQTT